MEPLEPKLRSIIPKDLGPLFRNLPGFLRASAPILKILEYTGQNTSGSRKEIILPDLIQEQNGLDM